MGCWYFSYTWLGIGIGWFADNNVRHLRYFLVMVSYTLRGFGVLYGADLGRSEYKKPPMRVGGVLLPARWLTIIVSSTMSRD